MKLRSRFLMLAGIGLSVTICTSALFGKASDNPLYEDIAEAEGIPLYSDGWSTVLSDEALKSDKIHANAAGYRQFAEGLHDYLKDEGWVR